MEAMKKNPMEKPAPEFERPERPSGAPPPTPVLMQSRFWLEEPESDNPFAARAAYCHGYDVYGGMLGRAGWADMVFLLFRGEAPSAAQAAAMEILAVALANPGPRDASVHAAMCGGVGGSPAASALIAALAVGAGSTGGGREIVLAMRAWSRCGKDIGAWKTHWERPDPEPTGIWPDLEHPVGCDPHGCSGVDGLSGVHGGPSAAMPVRQMLARLAALDPGSLSAWLCNGNADGRDGAGPCANLDALGKAAGRPLSLAGAAAAAFTDLGFAPEEGEMLFLLMRLPGAAAHALEQNGLGHKRFPFYKMELQDGPQSPTR